MKSHCPCFSHSRQRYAGSGILANLAAMKNGRWAWALLLLALLSLLFLRKTRFFEKQADRQEQQGKERKGSDSPDKTTGSNQHPDDNSRSPEASGERDGLNRDIKQIIYTRHAKCRMDCRMIDVSEVQEILLKGSINYQKSDLRSRPDPKYALEGNTHDGQHVRIVFAESPRGPVVITVIDLDKEWSCNCK